MVMAGLVKDGWCFFLGGGGMHSWIFLNIIDMNWVTQVQCSVLCKRYFTSVRALCCLKTGQNVASS